MGAAISAARMGCKVALIQDRPVLGGNGSSEVRVWAMGNIRRGKFPRIGEIIEEFADKATKSPGRAEEFGDDLKEKIVRDEKNIDLFLNHHAYAVKTENNHIVSVTAFNTRTSEHSEFFGRLFSDCTGHGTIGYLANADWEMEEKGRMGMSNMWAWDELKEPASFPETPWALDLTMDDFPYPRDHHGQWFWESGFDKDAIGDSEGIRDWNLRAVFGAFNAMKNRDGADKHQTAILTWVAYIGGPRESRRLMGDLDADSGRCCFEEGIRRRMRAQHLVDRPALSQRSIREKVSGQSVHQHRRPRSADRSQLWLSGALSLLLFSQHRQPVYGGTQYQRDA
jgi:hypothetical protein